jgi:hypothetical protein
MSINFSKIMTVDTTVYLKPLFSVATCANFATADANVAAYAYWKETFTKQFYDMTSIKAIT